MCSPSVSQAYARALARFLRSRGLPVAEPLHPQPAERIAGATFADELSRAGQLLDDPALGTAFGAQVEGPAFGLLGVAAASASTLQEAIHQLQRFESLTSTLGRMQLRRRADTVTLAWQPLAPVAPGVVEGILAGWVSFGRYLLAEPVPVLRVSFAHAARAPASRHEDHFQCPVRFDAGEHSVTIAERLLRMQPRCADQRLNHALSAWLDHCTAAVETPLHRPTTHCVAALLGKLAPPFSVDEDGVAHRLGLGQRSLQRRLAAEGTSFRHLLDASRAQRAIDAVLRAEAPLADVAVEIGLNEQSSLCRAFRRWTGYSPLALRARLSELKEKRRLEHGSRYAVSSAEATRQ